LIDHNGGEVMLADTGIKLVIPAGAIDEGKAEVVYLALLGNPKYAPKELKDDETFLTPVVMCGPHGLRFKKHVLLVLPHCVAVSDEIEEEFRGLFVLFFFVVVGIIFFSLGPVVLMLYQAPVPEGKEDIICDLP
jgi:hypothetical protein